MYGGQTNYRSRRRLSNAQSKKRLLGLQYYVYDVNSAAGPVGPHLLTSCTTKVRMALLGGN